MELDGRDTQMNVGTKALYQLAHLFIYFPLFFDDFIFIVNSFIMTPILLIFG